MKKMMTALLVVMYVFHMLSTNAYAIEQKHQDINKLHVKVTKTHQSRQSEKNRDKQAKQKNRNN